MKFRNSLLLRIWLVIKEFEYVTTTVPVPNQHCIRNGDMLFGAGPICVGALNSFHPMPKLCGSTQEL